MKRDRSQDIRLNHLLEEVRACRVCEKELPLEPGPVLRAKTSARLPNIELTLLIGQYAQRYHIPEAGKSVTETVQRRQEFIPANFPTPHPSPRNQLWLKRNPWFEQDLVPELRRRIREVFPELPDTKSSDRRET